MNFLVALPNTQTISFLLFIMLKNIPLLVTLRMLDVLWPCKVCRCDAFMNSLSIEVIYHKWPSIDLQCLAAAGDLGLLKGGFKKVKRVSGKKIF